VVTIRMLPAVRLCHLAAALVARARHVARRPLGRPHRGLDNRAGLRRRERRPGRAPPPLRLARPAVPVTSEWLSGLTALPDQRKLELA